jgi:hypothetical protein
MSSDALTYILVASISFTGLGLLLRYALKTKCSRIVLCCGLFECNRDVEAEERIEECKITHNISVEGANLNGGGNMTSITSGIENII